MRGDNKTTDLTDETDFNRSNGFQYLSHKSVSFINKTNLLTRGFLLILYLLTNCLS